MILFYCDVFFWFLDEIFRGGRRHHSSPRPSHGRLQVPLLSGITPPVVNLPDTTTQTLLDAAQNLPDSTTQTLVGAAHSLSNLTQSKHAAKPTNLWNLHDGDFSTTGTVNEFTEFYEFYKSRNPETKVHLEMIGLAIGSIV